MKLFVAAAALAVASFGASAPVKAQDYYLGQIIMGGWNFCPRGTLNADGQLLAINQNTALFSLFGTMYGGDGRTSFGLPDLRGRAAIHTGTGPGLSPRSQGQKGGAETVTLSQNSLPSHSHTASGTIQGTPSPASSPSPAGAVPALTGAGSSYAPPGGPAVAMAPGGVSVTVGATGGTQPVGILDPFQVIRYCVVMQGIYPSRS